MSETRRQKPMVNPTKTLPWLLEHRDYAGDDCLIWPFNRCRGYGMFGHKGKMLYAHRFMCELVNGPAPTSAHHAAHECGNGDLGCVNPRHLKWKTPSDNQYDRRRHGTTEGAKGPYPKLTSEQIQQLLGMRETHTQDEIAARFNISRPTVRRYFKVVG